MEARCLAIGAARYGACRHIGAVKELLETGQLGAQAPAAVA
jgi:hypothetical protein